MSLFGGEFPPLRQFQADAHESLRQGAIEKHWNQLIVAPTGSGKTILGLNVVKNAVDRAKRAMFLCDRKTLISQTSEVAREVGLGHHGIIQAQNPMYDLSRKFQIASVQTLMRRGFPDDLDVLIVDEAHCQYETWVKYAKAAEEDRVLAAKENRPPTIGKTRIIGLTATPFSKGLGGIFSNVINAATMSELTELGILVPMRIFSCRRPDMAGAETIGGEWTKEAAEEKELELVGDVVTEWTRLARDLKTIVFGPTILYCNELAKKFNDVGVTAAVFCADTPDDERTRILQDYACKVVQVLISVEALAKGFDVKDVGCVCDCRPMRKSMSTCIQMWGRGLRSSPETGKTECLLLDFSGNIIRFANDFSKFYFEGVSKLSEGEKLDKEIRKDDEAHEPKACPKCGYMPMGGKKCVGCGFERPAPASLVEHRPGEMSEVVLCGKKVLAPDQINLYAQLATYAKTHSDPDKQNGRAAHLFKDITGQWPPRGLDVATAPHIEPSRNLLNKIRSLHIAFQYRRAS